MKTVMKIKIMLGMAALCLLFFGCGPAHIVSDSTYGYTFGYLKADYNVSFDKAWRACERTIAALKGYDVNPERSLGKGSIKATIINDVVRFYITYKSQEVTEIVVRVGYVGDQVASQLVHDKIKENIGIN